MSCLRQRDFTIFWKNGLKLVKIREICPLNKELAWAKIVLRVKSTKIYTVQNGKKLWEFSKCSSEGLGHDNHLIDILTKRTCLAYMYASTHMVKWSWSLHGMSFHGSPVTHLTHRKGLYKIFQNFSKMYWSLVQTQFWLAQKFEKRENHWLKIWI